MTTITIAPGDQEVPDAAYRAVARDRVSVGRTAGAALDAITAQLDPVESGSLVIVLEPRPDEFFSADQLRRLQQLMAQHRQFLDAGVRMSPADRAELEELVLVETEASGRRVEAMVLRTRP